MLQETVHFLRECNSWMHEVCCTVGRWGAGEQLKEEHHTAGEKNKDSHRVLIVAENLSGVLDFLIESGDQKYHLWIIV